MDSKPPVFKAKTPVKLIVMLAAGTVLLLGGIFYAVWVSGIQIADAKKSGVIIEKRFVPQPEEQIILGKDSISTRDKAGEYILIVEVKGRDGKVTPYTVWVGKELYDSLKVGDPYDVGPALAPE